MRFREIGIMFLLAVLPLAAQSKGFKNLYSTAVYSTEQVAALKERIGKVFLSPELVHAAWDAIEGKTEVANG